MKSNKAFNVVRITAVIFATMVASACAPLQQQQSSSFLPDQLISADIADFLSHTSANSYSSFAQSPWGDNITIIPKAPYFSASGAKCRQLIVESSHGKRTELACTQDGLGWYQARALVMGNTQ